MVQSLNLCASEKPTPWGFQRKASNISIQLKERGGVTLLDGLTTPAVRDGGRAGNVSDPHEEIEELAEPMFMVPIVPEWNWEGGKIVVE